MWNAIRLRGTFCVVQIASRVDPLYSGALLCSQVRYRRYALHMHTRSCCQARMQRAETEHPLPRMTENSLICHKIIDIDAVEVLRGTVELANYITFHRLPVHVSRCETVAIRNFQKVTPRRNFHNKKIECAFKIQQCSWWKNSVTETVPKNGLQTLTFLTLIASPPPSDIAINLLVFQRDNEQLITLAHLSDYNVYRIPNAKRVFGAPFEWGACLRPNSNAEAEDTEAGEPGIKVIIFENEKSRTCWLTAMRLAKSGTDTIANSSATGCNLETLHQRIVTQPVSVHPRESPKPYVCTTVAAGEQTGQTCLTLIYFTRNLRSLTISIGLGLVFVNLRGMESEIEDVTVTSVFLLCESLNTFIELMLSVFKSNMAKSRLLPVSRNDNDNEKVNRSDRSNKSHG
ncbi:Growth factor receptor-bound protein 7 [Acromyrmex echinatior]|uniref:Growth factor receptor-bound protein 7 n=1 Tax=Acromyrmex echinatior TaxID=103372 RepID=F4WJQ7_ACREC|nr:Growth factor receptor-bound protein 7 [Acromyrmex echinatior]